MTEQVLNYIRKNFASNHSSNQQPDLSIFDELVQYLSKYNYDEKQVSENRSYVNNVSHITEILENIKSKIPYFDIEEFIHILNKHFKFYVTDYELFLAKSYKRQIKNYLGISINDISTEDMLVKLLNFKYLASMLTFSPHLLVLRFYLYKQGGLVKKEMSEKRPLDWSDFQEELHKRLTYESLLKVLDFYNSNLGSIAEENKLDIEKTIEYVASKTTRLNKFFIVDDLAPTQPIGNIQDIDIANELEQLDIKYDKLIKSTTDLNSPFIKQVETIVQEIELIGVIVKFNILFLDRKLSDSENLLISFLNNSLTTNHQVCLLIQTISQQSNKNNNLDPHLKNIFLKIMNANNYTQRCSNYINSSNEVHCYHETFMFYSIYKWYLIFIDLLQKYANPNFNSDISPEKYRQYHDIFLDPKISFCNSCYQYYKEYEKQLNSQLVRNNFIQYENKAFSTIFRQVFSDTCDIPNTKLYINSQKKHKTEVSNSLTTEKNLLNKLFVELKKEIFRCQKVIQKYLEDDKNTQP